MNHSYNREYYVEKKDMSLQSSEHTSSWTELVTEIDVALIDHVRSYPHIYNKKSKHYKNKNIRERSWVEIATILNSSVEECQKRWLRLRERFSRERRLLQNEAKSGSDATMRRKFALYNNMMFLSEHVQSRRSYTNILAIKRKITSENTPSPELRPSELQLSLQSRPVTEAELSSQIHTLSSPEPSPRLHTLSQPEQSLRVQESSDNSTCRDTLSSPTDFEMSVPSASNVNLSRSEDIKEECNFLNIRRKRCIDPVDETLLQVLTQISARLTNTQTTLSENDLAFGRWIASELATYPPREKKEMKEKIIQHLFNI